MAISNSELLLWAWALSFVLSLDSLGCKSYISKAKLQSPVSSGGSSSKKNIFGNSLIIANSELRKNWTEHCEWIGYTDEKEEREIFLKNINSEYDNSKCGYITSLRSTHYADTS